MTARGARHPGDRTPSALPSDPLTHVEVMWLEKRIEHWIRFGREKQERVLDRRRRILSFAPDTVFAVVRWAANDYGTVRSHLDVLRAVAPGEPYQALPFVRPGAEILLRVEGWPKVEAVLRCIDAIEALRIDPSAVAPDHWRHIQNRLAAGSEPRAYTVSQHCAFLLRRRAEP